MKVSKLITLLSLITVTTTILVTIIIALLPLFSKIPDREYTEHLQAFGSIYSGIIGVIFGYFIGKDSNSRKDDNY